MAKIHFIRIILLIHLLFFADMSAQATLLPVSAYNYQIDGMLAEFEDITLTISNKDLVISSTSHSDQSSSATLLSIVGKKMGEWKLHWDASGRQVKKINIIGIPSGIYIFTIRTGDRTVSRKIII